MSYGHIELLRWLLAAGADVRLRDEDGDTPLHVCETVECAVLLVEAGAGLTEADNDGKTPYHIAMEERRAEMSEWLAAQYLAREIELPAVELNEEGDEDEEDDAAEEEGEQEADDGNQAEDENAAA